VSVEGAGSVCSCWRESRQIATAHVNGVRFEPLSPSELVARVEAFHACGRSHVIHFCAAHPTAVARGDADYRKVLNRGLNVADGMGVVWALRMLGHRIERLTGSEALGLLCERGVARGLRHYLYGGAPETLERLRASLETTCPGISIVGGESPPFRPLNGGELAQASERIRSSGADLLWVGLGAPKQDLVAERLRELRSAPVILCVGAAFDFVSGAKQRAPRWMQRSGLEWLHRLACEPRRLGRRYLLGNAFFVWGVLRDHAGAGRT
jgi:N-acetylglucosaminyldiphosphoundecaprenol N-acetyl-beta-D-mannosaminyltransferase